MNVHRRILALSSAGTMLATICLATAAGALPPDAPHPDEMEFAEVDFAPPEPERFELANGLVVYFLADQSLPLVNWRAYVRAGAVCERGDRAGLAELVGQVMRTGGTTSRSPELVDETLEDIASAIETEVGDERTIVSASSLSRHLEPTMGIFADLLRRPAFRETKLEIARGRAIEAHNEEVRATGIPLAERTVVRLQEEMDLYKVPVRLTETGSPAPLS